MLIKNSKRKINDTLNNSIIKIKILQYNLKKLICHILLKSILMIMKFQNHLEENDIKINFIQKDIYKIIKIIKLKVF